MPIIRTLICFQYTCLITIAARLPYQSKNRSRAPDTGKMGPPIQRLTN